MRVDTVATDGYKSVLYRQHLRYSTFVKGVCLIYLEHGVCEEGLEHPSLTGGVRLVLFQQLVKVSVLLTVGQNLQTVLMVTHKLLIDVQHGQQDVKQVS